MVLFARAQPERTASSSRTPTLLKPMEMAAYELLALVAERAGDADTAAMARSIGEQEAAMATASSRASTGPVEGR